MHMDVEPRDASPTDYEVVEVMLREVGLPASRDEVDDLAAMLPWLRLSTRALDLVAFERDDVPAVVFASNLGSE